MSTDQEELTQVTEQEQNNNKNESDEKSEERSLQGPVVRLRRFSRRRACPFASQEAPEIDYKDVPLLQRFISERGKMIPARLSNVSRKKQRELARAIKRARYIALLPYIAR